MASKLNLIAPMSMVGYIDRLPAVDPEALEEQFVYDATRSPLDEYNPAVFRLEDLQPALSDIEILLWPVAELNPASGAAQYYYVSAYINGFLLVDDLWKWNGRTCSQGEPPQPTQMTISQYAWNNVHVQDGVAELRFVASRLVYAALCPESYLRMHLEFTHVPPAEPQRDWSPCVRLASRHKTPVAGPGEEQGIPHHHPAKFVFNRKRGCLVVRNVSVLSSVDGTPKACYSGAGVSPATATATRPGGGGFESRCVGELGGVPVRFVVDAMCDAE